VEISPRRVDYHNNIINVFIHSFMLNISPYKMWRKLSDNLNTPYKATIFILFLLVEMFRHSTLLYKYTI
jgi:hypothetical protein